MRPASPPPPPPARARRIIVIALDPDAPACAVALLRWAAHALALAPPADAVHLVAAVAPPPEPPSLGLVAWEVRASERAAAEAERAAERMLREAPAAAGLPAAAWGDESESGGAAITRAVLTTASAPPPWRGCAAALCDYAAAVRADVCVCGSRGHGALARRAAIVRSCCLIRRTRFRALTQHHRLAVCSRSALLGALGLGSVSRQLLHAAAVPICVVPPAALAAARARAASQALPPP
jgi:hypothetical protein